jgi:hypothetical protein
MAAMDAPAFARLLRHWAAVLRDALRRQMPDRSFEVEVIGADLADDEPLEVCVTFTQS